MKALTLTQPWATLVAIGAKKIETRSWRTDYRGPIAIHAGQGLGPVGGKRGLHLQCAAPRFFDALKLSMMRVRYNRDGETWPEYDPDLLPLGAIVAVATLVDCVRATGNGYIEHRATRLLDKVSAQECAFGDYSPGRYAWLLADVHRLPEPIPARGAQRLWNVPAEVEAALAELKD